MAVSLNPYQGIPPVNLPEDEYLLWEYIFRRLGIPYGPSHQPMTPLNQIPMKGEYPWGSLPLLPGDLSMGDWETGTDPDELPYIVIE